MICPRLRRFGITRVADVTRLDTIGVPVMLAVRPASETLAVSQGKGATAILARLSAVMESIELWHAERPLVSSFASESAHLDLPYDVRQLGVRDHGAPLERLRLRWVVAQSVTHAQPVPVPLDLVRLSFSGEHFWRPRVFQLSSTGLASGNTYVEACLHGLYEVIERDVLARAPAHDGVLLDIGAIEDPHIRALLDRLEAAGVEIELLAFPNPMRVPTFVARIWSALFPVICVGSGAHMDPCVALSRAITEAIQSRLTEITATRDDIPSNLDVRRDGSHDPRFRAGPDGIDLGAAIPGHGHDFDDIDAELAEVAARVEAYTGSPPLAVDLSSEPDSFSVVRVVCPGMRHSNERSVDRVLG